MHVVSCWRSCASFAPWGEYSKLLFELERTKLLLACSHDKNLDIPARYGITKRLEGVPALLIVDPRTDKLVNPGKVAALADARSMTPQALADWLAQWAR